MAVRNGGGAMEDPDSGYTIDQHLAPTAAAAHELASAGHRWTLIKLSLRETQQRQRTDNETVVNHPGSQFVT